MRAFKIASALLLLACVVSAEGTEESYTREQIDEIKAANANKAITAVPYRSDPKEVTTRVFNFDEGSYQSESDKGDPMLGMIVGFSCTAVFLISAAILIIYDEVTRHKTYDELIRRDLRKFKSSFQFN